MSLESAKAFIERMKTDEDFRKKVNDCKDDEVRRAFVKSAGYLFTKEDVDQQVAELSDQDLGNMSGGVHKDCQWFFVYLK